MTGPQHLEWAPRKNSILSARTAVLMQGTTPRSWEFRICCPPVPFYTTKLLVTPRRPETCLYYSHCPEAVLVLSIGLSDKRVLSNVLALSVLAHDKRS